MEKRSSGRSRANGPRAAGNRAGIRRRQALLTAARELFLEHGYDKVGIADIVARAGGSTTSVYSYFANKEGLFTELITDICEEFLGFLPTIPEGAETCPREVLTRIGEGACRVVLRSDVIALYRLAIAESYRFPHLSKVFYMAGPHAARRRIASYLAAATAKGTLTVPDPEMASEFFMGMLLDRGTLEMSLTGKTPSDENMNRRRVSEAVALMMARYSPTTNT